MSRTHHVTLTDRTDRWRYTCPRGHRSWEPTNSHFWCRQCAHTHDTDPTFHRLRDRKTDQLIERSQIRLHQL
jgi:hypothetical protein